MQRAAQATAEAQSLLPWGPRKSETTRELFHLTLPTYANYTVQVDCRLRPGQFCSHLGPQSSDRAWLVKEKGIQADLLRKEDEVRPLGLLPSIPGRAVRMKPEEPLKLSPFQPLHRHRILGVDHCHPILMSLQGLSECGGPGLQVPPLFPLLSFRG